MSEYELSPDDQRATLDRYFEPVTEAQRAEIARVWREAAEGVHQVPPQGGLPEHLGGPERHRNLAGVRDRVR